MKRLLISLSTGLLLLGNTLPAFAKEVTPQEEKKQFLQAQSEARIRALILKKKEAYQNALERREAISRKKNVLQKEQELLREKRLALKRKLGSSVQHGGLRTTFAFLKDVDAATQILTLQRGNSDVYVRVNAKDAEFYHITDTEKKQVKIEDLVNGSKVRVLLRRNKQNGSLHAVVVSQVLRTGGAVASASTSSSASTEVSASISSEAAGSVSTVGPGNASTVGPGN